MVRMADENAINIGNLLVERGLITQEQLKQVLAAVDKTNQSFQQLFRVSISLKL